MEPFIKVFPPVIEVTPEEAGALFVGADGQAQRAFLLAAVADIGRWNSQQSWPMQCREFVDVMTDTERAKVATMLGTLMDHLTEVK